MEKTKSKAAKDLTSGSPFRLILGFAVPLLFGMLFQQFYNMVDTIIVGRALGSGALASVGSTGSINFMIIGFCMGVCNGFAIPVSQMFGAKDYRALRRYVTNSVWLSAAFAIVMTAVTCILCRQILVWMNTPADIIDGAYSYIVVIFAGIPAVYLYNLLSAIIRSLGDSKSPLIFLGISSALNIVLDLLLVMPMGVAGTAVATVVSQGISGILCLFYMRKKFDILHFEREDWKLEKRFVLRLCGMGIPMGLQYSITAIGSVILQTSVNSLGSLAVASVTSASKISQFFCCMFQIVADGIAGIVQVVCDGGVVAEHAALLLEVESALKQFVDGMVKGVEKDGIEFQAELQQFGDFLPGFRHGFIQNDDLSRRDSRFRAGFGGSRADRSDEIAVRTADKQDMGPVFRKEPLKGFPDALLHGIVNRADPLQTFHEGDNRKSSFPQIRRSRSSQTYPAPAAESGKH